MLIMLNSAINILTFAIIAYNSEASIIQVTLLHFIKLVYIMFPIKINFIISFNSVLIINTNPIWELRSLLLAKDLLTKI